MRGRDNVSINSRWGSYCMFRSMVKICFYNMVGFITKTWLGILLVFLPLKNIRAYDLEQSSIYWVMMLLRARQPSRVISNTYETCVKFENWVLGKGNKPLIWKFETHMQRNTRGLWFCNFIRYLKAYQFHRIYGASNIV